MNNFEYYINQYAEISSSDWEILNSISTSLVLSKEQMIIRSNERFQKEIFIEKGVVRGFIVDEDGNEKSTSFFEEGDFMSTNTLRNNSDGKSIHNYQALNSVHLIVFEAKQLRQFFSRNKLLSNIGATIKEREILRISDRDKCLLQVTAKDKYALFSKCYPTIERYISQKHIASYLGITPVSLSRIKANSNS